MKTKIRLCVTQKDIDNGKRSDSFSCPIVLSLKRAAKRLKLGKKSKNFRVGMTIACFWTDEKYSSFVLPSKAQHFINDFDNKRPVRPFSFQIEV